MTRFCFQSYEIKKDIYFIYLFFPSVPHTNKINIMQFFYSQNDFIFQKYLIFKNWQVFNHLWLISSAQASISPVGKINWI